MNKEQLAARARIDRELLALDQKIERQDAIKTTAEAVLADLHAVREAMLTAGVALRVGGDQT